MATGQTGKKPASRKRIEKLATPKQPHTIWITTLGRSVQWGDQESLWPIRKEALSANATPRLTKLSEPKRNFQEEDINPEFLFSCGRSSVIWNVPDGAKSCSASSRLEQLSKPKRVPDDFLEDRDHYVFSCGRSSPIWDVSQSARHHSSYNPRFDELSQPKDVHYQFLPNRGVETIIPPSALKCKPSGRVEVLATPRERPDGPFRDPMWPVGPQVKNAFCSKRLTELSIPKGNVDGYSPPRGSVWSVPKSARLVVASDRLNELATPIVRATMDHVQFNPDAFKVKETALKARCTERLKNLAQPLVRET